MDLDTYVKRIEHLGNNYTKEVWKLLSGVDGYILGIPKQRMYLYGTDANDMPLRPKYKPSTIKKKKKKGQTSSHVTLRDTGKWKASWKLVKVGNKITFTAPNDSKTGYLVEHYEGNELFGFSPRDGEEIFKRWIKPYIDDIIFPNEKIDIKI